MIADAEVSIAKPRLTPDGRPFTELLHTWTQDNERRHALSRVTCALVDTPAERSQQVEAFLRRQLRPLP